MDSTNTLLNRCKAKSKLQASSAILLALFFVPTIIMSLFITPGFILDVAFWFLLYGSPFAVAGISGLLISKNENPTYFSILSIVFICFLVYCGFNFCFFLCYFIVLLIGKLTSSGSWDNNNYDDTGLGRGVAFLFMILFGLITVYFTLAAWIGLRGFQASKMMRNLLILGQSPGGYQQSLNMVSFQATYPDNYQQQLNAGNPNFNVYSPIMNNPSNINAYHPNINS